MGAVEHLKTLCCLGLKPESAMVAVTPLLHEIVPHGGTRVGLFEPDGTIGPGYSENPETGAHLREHLWRFMNDPLGLASLVVPEFRAVGIGWALHRQGGSYLESAYYREVEAPLDSCWVLDAMFGDRGRTFAGVNLTRPRSARRFTGDDVKRLDCLRPWLAHAFRPRGSGDARPHDQNLLGVAGTPARSEQLILTADAKVSFQTPGVEFLFRVIEGEPSNCTRTHQSETGCPRRF